MDGSQVLQTNGVSSVCVQSFTTAFFLNYDGCLASNVKSVAHQYRYTQSHCAKDVQLWEWIYSITLWRYLVWCLFDKTFCLIQVVKHMVIPLNYHWVPVLLHRHLTRLKKTLGMLWCKYTLICIFIAHKWQKYNIHNPHYTKEYIVTENNFEATGCQFFKLNLTGKPANCQRPGISWHELSSFKRVSINDQYKLREWGPWSARTWEVKSGIWHENTKNMHHVAIRYKNLIYRVRDHVIGHAICYYEIVVYICYII